MITKSPRVWGFHPLNWASVLQVWSYREWRKLSPGESGESSFVHNLLTLSTFLFFPKLIFSNQKFISVYFVLFPTKYFFTCSFLYTIIVQYFHFHNKIISTLKIASSSNYEVWWVGKMKTVRKVFILPNCDPILNLVVFKDS